MPYVYIIEDPLGDYEVYATFTGANGTLLSAYTPERGGIPSRIGTYEIKVQDNKAQGAGPSAGNNGIYTWDKGYADVVLTAKLSTADGSAPFAGLVGRVVDANNYFAASYIDTVSDAWRLVDRITSSDTTRDSVSTTINPAAGYKAVLILQGVMATAFLRDGRRIQYRGLFNVTATKHGLLLDDATSGPGRADDFGLQRLWFSRDSRTTLWSTNAGGTHDWVGRAYMVALSDGIWLAFYRTGTAHGSSDGRLHVRFSSDEGVSWSAEDTTLAAVAVTGFPIGIHGAALDAGEPTAGIAPNGDLILQTMEFGTAGVRLGTYQYRSTNDGLTWSDEGKINGENKLCQGGQILTVGTTMYMVPWYDEAGDSTGPYSARLYVSTNNATTWTYRSDMADPTTGGNESAIIDIGATGLLGFSREHQETKTWMSISDDLGVTWTVTNVTGRFGVLQRPKLRRFPNGAHPDRIYLVGRDRIGETTQYTVIYFSDDDGVSWEGPYYWDTTQFVDCGYCDILERASGKLYGLNYTGTDNTASMAEYVFTVIR